MRGLGRAPDYRPTESRSAVGQALRCACSIGNVDRAFCPAQLHVDSLAASDSVGPPVWCAPSGRRSEAAPARAKLIRRGCFVVSRPQKGSPSRNQSTGTGRRYARFLGGSLVCPPKAVSGKWPGQVSCGWTSSRPGCAYSRKKSPLAMSPGEGIGLLILAAFFLVVIWLLLHPPPRSRR